MIDRSPVWIGTVDLCLAVLAVVIVAVNPPKAAEGVHERGEYLLSMDWDVGQDADVDIWLLGPSKKPVFYGSRDVGCARLDSDNRGFLDAIVRLADGSETRIESSKETIQLRCIEPGHFELAAALYAYREKGMAQELRRDIGLKVHAEIVGLNPSIHVAFAKDVVLDRMGQTINLAGFDLDRDGRITLTDAALEPITETFQRTHSNSGYTPGAQP